MNSESPASPPERLIALDAFRGITIAGMLLVNNPGSWQYVYGPLRHADWHGWTPTDLVFPFFLFIVGVAMTFSFRRRIEQGANRIQLLAQVVRRSLLLILLGLILNGFPDFRLLDGVRFKGEAATTVAVCWSVIRLIVPYLLAIVGLVLLYADSPVLAFKADGRLRVRKIVALVLLVAAAAYFAADFRYFEEAKLRVPGVLQRIGLCYFFASLVVLCCGMWGRAAVAAILLIGYWAIVTYVHPPAGFTSDVKGPEGLLHDWIDSRILGVHLYRERPDPEGLLSTIPAVATILAGVLTGHWLQSRREKVEKLIGLFAAANVVLVLGLWAAWVFPLNKKIWTSSYVLATAGVALHFLALCYWLIDIRGQRRWAWPFVVFGSNAIVVYVAASMTAKTLALLKLGDGQTTVKTWLYEHLCASWAGPQLGSLAYPILYNALWLIPMYILYRKRIFVKI